VIINTYDYKCEDDGSVDLIKMKKCNVDLPFLLSEFCNKKNKKYVHFSTATLYHGADSRCSEGSSICANDSYTASKLLGESGCSKKDLIIRTRNLFNNSPVKENALFRAIINSTPSKNLESYSWTVDVIRGTVTLLKNKQRGLFNLSSNGFTSQAEICAELGIKEIAPTSNDETCKYIKLGIDKLMEHIIPMNIMDNIPKCFEKLKDELGE
jgi:dTDP-4-dehydrorhamnose reductase